MFYLNIGWTVSKLWILSLSKYGSNAEDAEYGYSCYYYHRLTEVNHIYFGELHVIINIVLFSSKFLAVLLQFLGKIPKK